MQTFNSNRAHTIARLALTARLLFQYGVGLGYYSNMIGRSRSGRLITKSVYTWVSEWVSEWLICISESPQETRFNASRFHEFINMINILYKQKVKCQRIKRFLKGTWNSMLTLGEFVARVIVLRFLLVKKMVSIKTAHALYRDNGPLSRRT